MKAGIIFQKGALWIGMHYSPAEKRYCINIIPCLTIWIATSEGRGPKAPSMLVWDFAKEPASLHQPLFIGKDLTTGKTT